MAQTPEGARKIAAARIGVTVDLYAAMVSAGHKWCTACKRWHKRKAFGRDASRSDGLSAKCTASRIVKTDGPGKFERRRAAAKGLAWCCRCECWLPADEVQQGKCREHLNEMARTWYSLNAQAVSSQKNARKRGIEPIPAWWREAAFADFGGMCAYGCGRQAAALDHITPVALGGMSEPANLVPVCTTCNSRKRHNNPAPWLSRGFAAFPDQWLDVWALAQEVGRSTEWAA